MKIWLILTALFLAGCQITPNIPDAPKTDNSFIGSQLDVAQVIQHNGKNYRLVTQKDLETVARFAYYPTKEKHTGRNWKSMIEILHDRTGRSLEDRIALRERFYQSKGVKHFNFKEQNDILYAFVIYEPSDENQDWRVDVAKGVTMENCGFVQYQFSRKIERTQKMINMGNVKLIGYLKKYVIDKELEQFAQSDWQIQCKPKSVSMPEKM